MCTHDSNILMQLTCVTTLWQALMLHIYQYMKSTINCKNVLCLCYWYWFCECKKVMYLPSCHPIHLHMYILQNCTFAMMAIRLCSATYLHDTQLFVVSVKINVCAWHANFSCICLQTYQNFKSLGKSYKIHSCYSHVCIKFKVNCTVYACARNVIVLKA